ncbi:hypothetical protein J6V85_04265 [Candidatus Saccharibacteria bacterium]|nr:hypothetical protein [Candidatus Saccharibacteria bacterium]
MKIIKNRFAIASTFLLATLCAANVNATNPYSIEYTGGVALGTANVQIDSELVESLTPLMQIDSNVTVDVSDSNLIRDGYLLSGSLGNQCRAVKYVTVSNEDTISLEDDVTYYLTQDQYTISVAFNNIVLENIEDGKTYAVGIDSNASVLYTGYQIFDDSSCQTARGDIDYLGQGPTERIFVDMIMKIHNAYRLDSPLLFNNLYFALTDIDMAQSYKILNSGNTLKKSHMVAADPEDLQSRRGSTLRNMYVEGGDYIYSEYSYDGFRMSTLNLPDTANVYTNIYRKTQNDGLNIVLGFVTNAYNGIEYYILENDDASITYRSDNNGSIVGEATEDIAVGGNPSGITTKPNDGYEFSHWVANKDVELKDYTIIAAGEPISNAQLKNIVVTDDLVLTAVHKAIADDDDLAPGVPNTGMNTGNTNATIITVSVFGILLGALFIRLLPRLTHKKVNFSK